MSTRESEIGSVAWETGGAVRHGVVLYLRYSRIAIKRLFARPARHRGDKEKKSRVSVFSATTTTTRWASFEEMQSYRFFPVTALSARMEIRSASRHSSSFTPSIRRARARHIPEIERVEEDFYLRRRKQISFEIFIRVGIMLRDRLADGIISNRASFRFPDKRGRMKITRAI